MKAWRRALPDLKDDTCLHVGGKSLCFCLKFVRTYRKSRQNEGSIGPTLHCANRIGVGLGSNDLRILNCCPRGICHNAGYQRVRDSLGMSRVSRHGGKKQCCGGQPMRDDSWFHASFPFFLQGCLHQGLLKIVRRTSYQIRNALSLDQSTAGPTVIAISGGGKPDV
jgi:hypothetical protein